jgi:hypothetical protein
MAGGKKIRFAFLPAANASGWPFRFPFFPFSLFPLREVFLPDGGFLVVEPGDGRYIYMV